MKPDPKANGKLQRQARAKGHGAKRARPTPVDQRALVSQREARRATADAQVHKLIDKACGPQGALILHALAVIALGDSQARQQFFGEAFRVQAKDRNFALAQLALRRYGRAPVQVPGLGDPAALPVVIQHIYAADLDGEVVADA